MGGLIRQGTTGATVIKNHKVKQYTHNYIIYPAMTAFTDQYILPNNFFDISQL